MKLPEWVTENKAVFSERDLRFLLKPELKKSPAQLEKIKKLYIQGVPMAYILGKEEFFGYEFEVSSKVLIPRPETELLVEKAIELLRSQNLNSVLDLCSGCGNIAISIAKEISKPISIFASDISLPALKLLKNNIKRHKVSVEAVSADLLSAFKPKSFDLIISNPPYVETESIKGPLNYEPWISLWGGKDGLDFIKRILDQARTFLKDKGYLIMEIGYQHKPAIDKYGFVEWIKDYSGHLRGVVLKTNYEL